MSIERTHFVALFCGGQQAAMEVTQYLKSLWIRDLPEKLSEDTLSGLTPIPKGNSREQKRHIKLLHMKLFPVAPVTGPPGQVSGQKDLCSLGSEDST